MGRIRLKALHQNRAEFYKGTGDYPSDFVADSIESLLKYYCEGTENNRDTRVDDTTAATSGDVQDTNEVKGMDFINPAVAVRNLPEPAATLEKSESKGKADVMSRILDKEEVMGTLQFFSRLKTNGVSAENEWYEVFSEYIRQKKAQKERKQRTAKIFRRAELLVRAATSCDTWKRESVYNRSVADKLNLKGIRDNKLPEGNDLVGRTVKLVSSELKVRTTCKYV
jgi:predicted secreted protein